MIASNFSDFAFVCVTAARDALNTDSGQRIMTALLKEQLRKHPKTTPEEWEKQKEKILVSIFCKALTDSPELLNEAASHIRNEQFPEFDSQTHEAYNKPNKHKEAAT